MDLLLNVYRFVSVSVYYVYRICMNFYGFVDFLIQLLISLVKTVADDYKSLLIFFADFPS